MAIIKNSIVLQNATGTLGEFFVKDFRGRKILARKSFQRKKSNSDAAVKGRTNFAATVLISKTVNKQPVLKELWKFARVDASSPFQKMMAYNGKRVNNGMLTRSNGITPGGIPLSLNSASVQDNSLNLDFTLPPDDYIIFPAHIYAFLYFDHYESPMFALKNKISEASPDANYTINFALDDKIRKALEKDAKPVIYAAVVGSVTNREAEYWSATAVVQL